jgi:hypothetical protein
MYPGLLPPSRFSKLVLLVAPLGWLGCGGGGTDVIVPSLSIATSTSGIELDPDGYSLVIDGAPGQAIGTTASVTIDRLSDGPHTIELSGLAPNCVANDNPRTVVVSAGNTINVSFTVTCSATTGSIEVTTATNGPGSDPDGFMLVLDGSENGPIGTSATTTLSGLTPGAHALGLTALAANCQVVGENPRTVTVTAGQTTQVPFAITCSSPPSSTGTLRLTTATSGSPTDPDGYTVSIDGAPAQSIGTNATLTLTALSVGTHTVRLGGLASNCQLSGANPRSATIAEGQTTTITFTITCGVSTGGLAISIEGLPAGVSGSVTVTGPNNYLQAVTESRTLSGLAVGDYAVSAATVTAGSTSYTATVDRSTVSVTAGATARVTVTYRSSSSSSVNLRIEGLYLTQSTQRRNGSVPLVRNRRALLRVFVTASQSNNARPAVRVRFMRGASVAGTITVQAPGAGTPVSVDEGAVRSSWNSEVEASLLEPGTAVIAEVDPDGAIPESNERDNTFPTSGNAQQLDIRGVPPARIRFVPVLQTANGLQGRVGNTAELIELTRRMYPLASLDADIRSVYTATGPLDPDNANGQWNQILSDIEALRVAEGSDRTYYGVVRLSYGAGIVGNGFVGLPSAIGSDDPRDVSGVLAHELGHTWGRYHSPCGSPGGLDPNEQYPYPNGRIGVYGSELPGRLVIPPSTPDIMGYCADPWISDHTYLRVMDFRQSSGMVTTASPAQPVLLVWGQIENGRPILNPAFRIVARPHLPAAPGPYSLEATSADGSQLFRLTFDAAPVADVPGSSRHFAFAVPLESARAARLGSLRLRGPGGEAAAAARPTPQLQGAAAGDSVVARREAGGVVLEWNAGQHPMVLVRDPVTGEILSFAREGRARISTTRSELDLVMSDRVQSHLSRVKAR